MRTLSWCIWRHSQYTTFSIYLHYPYTSCFILNSFLESNVRNLPKANCLIAKDAVRNAIFVLSDSFWNATNYLHEICTTVFVLSLSFCVLKHHREVFKKGDFEWSLSSQSEMFVWGSYILIGPLPMYKKYTYLISFIINVAKVMSLRYLN